jgi:hypothetical protein
LVVVVVPSVVEREAVAAVFFILVAAGTAAAAAATSAVATILSGWDDDVHTSGIQFCIIFFLIFCERENVERKPGKTLNSINFDRNYIFFWVFFVGLKRKNQN